MAKIMLVEDDRNLSAIYSDRLLAEGYQVVSAHDGEEALAMAVKEKPDLIISDVMMPKISGFDMLDILRSTPETKDTKVIMMTALSQTQDQDRADKLGADRYLVKSQVTLDDVARAVNEILNEDKATAVPAADRPATSVQPVVNMAIATPPVAAVASSTPDPNVPPDPAPTPVAEPVAPTDLPTALPPTGPGAAPASDVTTSVTTDPQVVEEVENTAEEQADIAAQIDKFVSSNVPDTPVHAAADPTSVGSQVATVDEPAPVTATATATAATDAALEYKPAEEAPETASEPIKQPGRAMAQQPSITGEASPESNIEVDTPPATPSPRTGGERVLQPLNDIHAQKANIYNLYEKEMANEAAEAAGVPVAPPPEPVPEKLPDTATPSSLPQPAFTGEPHQGDNPDLEFKAPLSAFDPNAPAPEPEDPATLSLPAAPLGLEPPAEVPEAEEPVATVDSPPASTDAVTPPTTAESRHPEGVPHPTDPGAISL